MRPIRHFLSHQHVDRPQLALLEADMRRRGLLSWRDRKDQHLGAATDPAVERAIREDTDGLALYGSRNVIDSWYVWNREWPPAYLRHQAERDAGHAMPYPLIPLLDGIDIEDLKAAALSFNTTTPSPFNGERLDGSDARSRRPVARGLLRTALARRCLESSAPLRLHLTTFGVSDQHDGDIVVDWTEDFTSDSVPWDELLWGRDDLKAELARTGRSLEVSVQTRLAPAFAFGHAFPSARIPIMVGPDRWQVGRAADPALISCSIEDRQGDRRVAAVIVSLARDVSHAAEAAIAELAVSASRVARIAFAPGVAVVSQDGASAAAHSFGRVLRDLGDGGVVEAHLFMAAPADLALLLGTAINAGPAITLYHTANGRYVPSVRLSDGIPSQIRRT